LQAGLSIRLTKFFGDLEVFMKLVKKTAVVLLLLAVLALPVFAQTPDTDIVAVENAINDIGEILGKAMITNSALGLNWSDAYIGQLIGLPPHFGIGASAGFTAIPLSKFEDIYTQFGGNTDELDMPTNFLPLPTVAGEIRLGGFFLPFDIGIKALPLPEMDIGDAKLKYFMVGGDFRYALMREQGWKPAISVGIGLTYTNVNLKSSIGDSTEVDLTELGGSYINQSLTIAAPELDFSMKNTTLDLKVQISKKLFIITPYLGLGFSYGWSTVDFGANATVTGPGGNWEEDVAAYTGMSISSTGLSKSVTYNGMGLRGFGGLSLNIFVVRLDVTGLYDILNQYWGASIGFRIQI
jgi:hypothetical protein